MSTLGSMAMTPAMATRRFCPPESSKGSGRDLVAQAGKFRRPADPAVDLLLSQLHVPGSESDVLVDRLLKQLVLRVLKYQPHLKAGYRG